MDEGIISQTTIREILERGEREERRRRNGGCGIEGREGM